MPVAVAKTPKAWSVPHALIIGFSGFAVLFLTIFLLGREGWRIYRLLDLSNPELPFFDTVVESIAVAGAGLIGVKALRPETEVSFLDSIEWRQSRSQAALCTALGLGASLMMRLAFAEHIAPRISYLVAVDRRFALVILGVVILEPLIEEIYYRGILFGALSPKLGPMLAISITTLIFVFGHPVHKWTVLLPISILLGIVRVRTSSTANSFAFHAAYNLGVVLWGIR